jgi:hypothetical protein
MITMVNDDHDGDNDGAGIHYYTIVVMELEMTVNKVIDKAYNQCYDR